MPEVTKVNPILRNEARSFNGKSVSHFTLTITPDITDSLGPDGALQEILQTVTENATLVLVGEATSSALDVFVEGEFPSSDYGTAGTLTFAEYLEDQIQALGEVDGKDLSGTTVALTATFFADDVVADYAS
jgi:hypothetical protein